MPTTFANAAELQARLGGVPLERIRVTPEPGTATVDDLLHWQDRCDVTLELVDGTLVEKAIGSWEGRIAARLIFLIESFLENLEGDDLGLVCPGDSHLRIEFDRIRAPDVSFIAWEQFPNREIPDDALWHVFPDLAVEVLSRSNRPGEMELKRDEFLAAGTRLVWMIDPASRTAVIHRPQGEPVEIDEEGTLDGEDVLPGFAVKLGDLFAGARGRRGEGTDR